MYSGLRDLAVHEAWHALDEIAAACREVTPMGLDGGEPVIQLDDRGVALLAEWAGPCTHFLVEKGPDNAIVLHPVSGMKPTCVAPGSSGKSPMASPIQAV